MGITLCDASDIKKRLGGRNLTTEEDTAWPGLAEEATVLVEGYLDREWVSPAVIGDVPLNVRVVTSRMVARTFITTGVPGGQLGGTMLPGTKSFNSSMGPLGHTTTFGDDVVFGSPYLSKSDKLMLRKRGGPVIHVPMFQVDDRSPTERAFARQYGYEC